MNPEDDATTSDLGLLIPTALTIDAESDLHECSGSTCATLVSSTMAGIVDW
eukprot:CAMPEP_0197566280 /NCGR_PEP_ID=MMETSP1320-20131121/33588_1 /TAXON_ID=91990 /ORGANISM="Bolidomonas sp., Strain RCC2347" /LENGTH=50 /DNA_ID=CAMNT_0043128363 /DNA_START=205 /DNA_END=357 /DNA_ORIENTATION=+